MQSCGTAHPTNSTCGATGQPIANIASNHSRVWMRRGPQESSLLATHCCCQQPSTLCTAQNAQCTTCSTHSTACTQHTALKPNKAGGLRQPVADIRLDANRSPRVWPRTTAANTPVHHAQHSTPCTAQHTSNLKQSVSSTPHSEPVHCCDKASPQNTHVGLHQGAGYACNPGGGGEGVSHMRVAGHGSGPPAL
jgi:hypothetical protein